MNLEEKINKLEQEVQELKTQLGKEQLEKINPFERAERGRAYYALGPNLKITMLRENGHVRDDRYYYVANYCTDKEIMEQRALHEKLHRLLWRFSMENGGDKIDWNNRRLKCTIHYDYHQKSWGTVLHSDRQSLGCIYFIDRATATRAITKILEPFVDEHPDFDIEKCCF